ncbi:PAS domain-containing protein [Dankookia sp. GCM10030260]|uniref:PAS domain-containing protein n=1 Tax=Dankookia sp. GCM10030260 TaxID=3273390 RepID=UPI0036230F4A
MAKGWATAAEPFKHFWQLVPPPLAARSGALPGLRSYLLGLLLLALLPALVVGAVAAGRVLRSYHDAVRTGLLDTARALATAIDREIGGELSTLTALAASPSLDGGPSDIIAFAVHARRAAAALGTPISVVDRDLRLVLDTDLGRRPAPAFTGATEAAKIAFTSHRPIVSPLVTGAVTGAPTVMVLVPVLRADGPTMLLATRLEPAGLARILASQALTDRGVIALIDSRDVVVARSAEQAHWLGRAVPGWLAVALETGTEGVTTGHAADGSRLLVAHRHLETAAGWAVTVVEPVAALRSTFSGPAFGIALGGMAIFCLGLAAVAGLHRRVVGPIEALTRQAEALGACTARPATAVPDPGPVRVAELERLRRSLLHAAAALSARAEAERRSRAALAASERRYRRLAEAGNMTIWRADRDGQVTEAQGWSLMTGQPTEALRGEGWVDALHPDDAARTLEAFRTAGVARQAVAVEYRLRTRLGTMRWVRSRSVPIFDEADQLVEWIGVVEDIDARRRAEEAMQALLHTLDLAAVLERDRDGRIRFWSAGCELLLGWTAAEAIGANLNDLLAPAFPLGRAELEAALARDGEWSGEVQQQTRTGKAVTVLCRMVLRPGTEGAPGTVLEALMDVTALRLAEDALRESESRVLRALAAGRVGAWEWDLSTGRVTGSPGRESILFGRPTGFIRRHDDIIAIAHPEDRPRIREAMRRVMANETPEFDIEYRVLRPDGTLRWVHTIGRTATDAASLPQRVSGVSIDVTERHVVQEREALLVREVDHRAKNALAVVQSVLRLSTMDEPRAYAASVGARVSALSRAHSLLAQEGWAGVSLQVLIEREVAPGTAQGSAAAAAITLEGPALRLAPTAVQPMTMVLHELAMNARQHGALSRPGGRLRIAWHATRREGEDGMLRLHWQETAAAPAEGTPPERRGFGVRVIEATVRGQLGGTLAVEWSCQGLECRIAIPLARWVTPATIDAEAA